MSLIPKPYLLNIIPRLRDFSEKLDKSVLLIGQKWVALSEDGDDRIVFIFNNNGELIVAINGEMIKGKWDFVLTTTLALEYAGISLLYDLAFKDAEFLALKLEGSSEVVLFFNESIIHKMNSIDKISERLENKYLLSVENNLWGPIYNPSLKYDTWHTSLGTYETGGLDSMNGVISHYLFRNKLLVSDGKYKLGFMFFVYTENGRIYKRSIL
jgi:hypothetical protein